MCKNMEIQKKSQILAKGFDFIVYIDYVKYTSILQYIQMMLNTCLKLNLHYTHSTSFLILRNTWSFILFYNFMGNDRVKILCMYYNLYMQKSLKQHFFFLSHRIQTMNPPSPFVFLPPLLLPIVLHQNILFIGKVGLRQTARFNHFLLAGCPHPRVPQTPWNH